MTKLENEILKELRDDVKEILANMVHRDECEKKHGKKTDAFKWKVTSGIAALGVIAAWVKLLFFA